MNEPKKRAGVYLAALKIVAGVPDERGKTYGSILHGHESEFIMAVLAGKSIEEAFGVVKGDGLEIEDMEWIRELSDKCGGEILPLDELRKLLGELEEPLSSTIVRERYGDRYKAIVCRQCRKDLPDHRLVMVVKHMLEEHGADTVDKLRMLRIGFGEKPRFDADGVQTAFPVQMFLYQFAMTGGLELKQALKNAKCLAFMEEPPLEGSEADSVLDDIEPLDLTRNPPVSIAYICAACGGFAYGPADCLSIDTGTTFTCEECDGKTVVSLMTVDEYVNSHKKDTDSRKGSEL